MSNPILDASLAANLATLTRIVDPPTGKLGFGTEPICVTDVTADWADVDSASPIAVVYATIRRWTTPRGMLPDDLDYGRDVRAYCNKGMTAEQLRALAQSLASEAEKDDRVSECEVTLSASLVTRTLDIRATITPNDPTLAPITFTFAVTDAQVLIDTIAVENPINTATGTLA